MRKRSLLLILIAALAVMAILPAVASAAITTDAYGRSYIGATACLGCHGSNYGQTTHQNFAKDVSATVSQLIPSSTNPDLWPAVVPASGLQPVPADIYLQLGSGKPGAVGVLEYVGKAAGPTVPDDHALFDPLGFNVEKNLWDSEGSPVGTANYAQQCAGCHQTGLTRPADATYPLPAAWGLTNPTITPTTPTRWAGLSIQCETCHGTGKTATAILPHWGTGVGIVGFGSQGPIAQVGSTAILDSRVCGQCHVSGVTTYGATTANRKDNGKPFSTPNGYTTDMNLLAGFKVDSLISAPAKFYPNGADKSMRHDYFNEWRESGHSVRTKLTSSSPDASPYQAAGNSHFNLAGANAFCLKCHTGEGFLSRKGAPIVAGLDMSTDTAARANTGAYGQECAVCHYSHKTDGSGLGVREADAAGVGSAAGRAANASMCEDCHNWQYEVQNAATVANLPLNTSRVSHPTRETLHGKGMYDVPAGTEFMPNATCQQCHMPTTFAEVADPGPTQVRYSHRMLPMLPGDAVAWSVRAGGDSCTPCHAGETRAQLQASIDTWQQDTIDASNTAAADLAAAALRVTDENVAGTPNYILYNRSRINLGMAIGDGSSGVHNPPYVLAGLNKASFLAKSVGGSFGLVAATVSPVSPGSLAFVTGKVNFGGTLGGAAGADLILKTLGGTTVGTAVADGGGNFAFTVAPSVTTQYQVVWARSGDPVTNLTSSTQTITVTGTVSTMLPVYRFLNLRTGTYFYTADAAEKNNVVATLGYLYRLEGVAYYVNTANPANNVPLYRFLNLINGTYFYTADAAEKNNVVATLWSTYRLEGVAYYVSSSSAGGAAPVWRFLNLVTGTYFYTADVAEKNNVVATLGYLYRLEGVAFYLAP